jgi:hypothetical protein
LRDWRKNLLIRIANEEEEKEEAKDEKESSMER